MKKTNREMTKRPSFRKTIFPVQFQGIKKIRSAGGLFLGIILLNGCATFGQNKPYQINRMPPPVIFDDTLVNPFTESPVLQDRYRLPLLYATTREPAGSEDQEPFYKNERGQLIRLGSASIMTAPEGSSWDALTRFSELRSTRTKIPLYVGEIEEYGSLGGNYSVFPWKVITPENTGGEDLFLYDLKQLLNRSSKKEIYLFVHGYNVNYENPLLMSSQFWHYLGYRGAFITFSWASFHKESSYLGDLDTVEMTAKALREFLQFLAERSGAEKIHIIGYSAGTRLVTLTLNQISLLNSNLSREESRTRTKLGSVILLASDMDRELFGTYLTDGILDTVDQMNIYISEEDQLLKASHFLHNYPRLGEKWNLQSIPLSTQEYIRRENRLHFIDVSDAERVATRGGHFYFLDSPWVSSDFLTTLYAGTAPAQRGLILHETLPYWRFPADYEERLKKMPSPWRGGTNRALSNQPSPETSLYAR